MGFIRVSERRQPQPERPRQDGPRPVYADLRHCGDGPAHRAGPPPLLSARESFYMLRLLSVTISLAFTFVFSFFLFPSSASFLPPRASPRVTC